MSAIPKQNPASPPSRKARADQILSHLGYCSRSEAARWIRQGRVALHDRAIQDPSEKVDPTELQIDGEPAEFPLGLFVAFHKPAGLVCSHEPSEGPSLYDVLPPRWRRRNPPATSIGRLDKDATGLLLITDLGQLVHHFTSPRKHVAKVYEVETDVPIRSELAAIFASGALHLDGEPRPCQPALLEWDPNRPTAARLTLQEGKYHQVKRMFASQGCRVIRLHRTHFGPYTLGSLAAGQWAPLPLPALNSLV